MLTFPIPQHGEANDARGRSPVDPAVFRQPRTRIIATSGQSMLANFSDAAPTTFNQNSPAYELCIFDGIIRQCDGGPHMNMNGWPHFPADEHPQRVSVLDEWGRALCGLGKNARTLLCGLNIGGTCSWQWVPGTLLFDKAIAALDVMRSIGLEPTEWVHVLGHGDRYDAEANGLSTEETAARFAANTTLFIRGLRDHGYAGKIIIGQGSYQNGCVEEQRLAVKAGQKWAAMANNCVLGPDDDFFRAPVYRAVADGCHWSESGRWASTYAYDAQHPERAWVSYFHTM